MKQDGKRIRSFYLRYIVALYFYLISFNKAKINTIIMTNIFMQQVLYLFSLLLLSLELTFQKSQIY